MFTLNNKCQKYWYVFLWKEIPWPPPSRFSPCSGYISPNIPPLIIIQIQYCDIQISQYVFIRLFSKENNLLSVSLKGSLNNLTFNFICPHSSFAWWRLIVLVNLLFSFIIHFFETHFLWGKEQDTQQLNHKLNLFGSNIFLFNLADLRFCIQSFTFK